MTTRVSIDGALFVEDFDSRVRAVAAQDENGDLLLIKVDSEGHVILSDADKAALERIEKKLDTLLERLS